MLFGGCKPRFYGQTARHAQVDGQKVAACKAKAQKLSPPRKVGYDLPPHALRKLFGQGRDDDLCVFYLYVCDFSFQQVRREDAPHRFHFGQFGHIYLFAFFLISL